MKFIISFEMTSNFNSRLCPLLWPLAILSAEAKTNALIHKEQKCMKLSLPICLAHGLPFTRCLINAHWLEPMNFLLKDNLDFLLLVTAPEREGRPRSSTLHPQPVKG